MLLKIKKTKKASHQNKVLRELEKAGLFGKWNYELAQPDVGGLAWHRRITDLRKAGHPIEKMRMDNGQFKYFLVPEDV